jgi:hypothetical protein
VRKRAGTFSVPQVVGDAPKVLWALDFQFDSITDGKAIKIASMVDEHTRESLLIWWSARSPRSGSSGRSNRCSPSRAEPPTVCVWTTVRSWFLKRCNGSVATKSVCPTFPGTPWNYGYIESFNNRLCRECLNHNHWNTLLPVEGDAITALHDLILE